MLSPPAFICVILYLFVLVSAPYASIDEGGKTSFANVKLMKVPEGDETDAPTVENTPVPEGSKK